MRQAAEAANQLDYVLKLLDLERKAMLDLGKFTRELLPADESRLAQTSKWFSIRDCLTNTLRPYPEAARAVADALANLL